MNFLITGGDGFIGQHFINMLIQEGHSVVALYHEKLTRYFIPNSNRIRWIHCNLSTNNDIGDIGDSIDVIVHLAAISRNDLSKKWSEFVTVNAKGTENIAKLAEMAGVKRFVYVSTVEAAGFGNGLEPRKETDNPKPDNNYGKSKLLGERVLTSKKWNFDYVIVRLPMIYGPGTKLIVPKLFGAVKLGWYPIIGDGKTKMEFCFVENAINAIYLCAIHKAAPNELFYISDQKTYSIKEVIENIAISMNIKIKLVYIPVFIAYIGALSFEILAKIFPFHPIKSKYSGKPFITRETVYWTTRDVNWVSSQKIRHLLNYNPSISIQEGCKITAQWLRKEKWL